MNMTSATYEASGSRNPSLRDILVSLSFALDLTEGAVPGHAIRSCLLALRIGLQAGVEDATIADLYYACLLKDVGCSSNSARMCQIVGADDRAMKAAIKIQDWTKPIKPQISMLKLLWKQVLPNASVFDKGARILKVAAAQSQTAEELVLLRCDRGAQIVRKLGLPQAVAIGVRHLDEHWDGGGYPQGLKGQAIPLISRLMGIAQHLDAFAMSHGVEKAIDTLVETIRPLVRSRTRTCRALPPLRKPALAPLPRSRFGRRRKKDHPGHHAGLRHIPQRVRHRLHL